MTFETKGTGYGPQTIHSLLKEARRAKHIRGVPPTSADYHEANGLDRWLVVTAEELGETARPILELNHAGTREEKIQWTRNLIEESAQTAQLSLRLTQRGHELLHDLKAEQESEVAA